MKERVSITLEKEILKQLDEIVDKERIKNRSHAVEMLLSRALGNHVPKTAVVLAGGKGTRLRPLTYEIPKALIPVQGKALTEHHFDLFKKYDVKNIIMAVGPMKEKIREHLGDGKKFGVSINYIEENEPLGTAGSLRELRNHLSSSFIVANVDDLKEINIAEMFQFHKKNRAMATIALTTVDDATKYGVARLSGNKILEFVEKPRKPPSKLINSGFYILEPEAIGLIPKGFSMLEKDVFPKLAEQGKLFGYPFSGQWYDTGTIETYEKAIKEWRGIR